MFKFEDYQNYSKTNYDAVLASAAALTKGYQTIAQEIVDFSRKSLEKNQEVAGKFLAVRALDKAMEVQQGFARESYDTLVSEATKINDLYVATAKEAYKPFESGFASFGIKFPTTK